MGITLTWLQELVFNVRILVQHVIIKNVSLVKRIHISMMEDVIILAQPKHNLLMVFTVEIV